MISGSAEWLAVGDWALDVADSCKSFCCWSSSCVTQGMKAGCFGSGGLVAFIVFLALAI